MIFLSGREKKVVTIRTNEQTDRQAPTSLLDVQIVVISTAEWSTSLLVYIVFRDFHPIPIPNPISDDVGDDDGDDDVGDVGDDDGDDDGDDGVGDVGDDDGDDVWARWAFPC